MRLIQKVSLGLGLSVALVAGAAHAQQQFINVLTGGQSGVYYPMGVALSQIYAKAIPNVRATAQVTKASAENLNLLLRMFLWAWLRSLVVCYPWHGYCHCRHK